IITRLYSEEAPFDYDGEFYHLKQAMTRPASLQRPRPVTMNAAFGGPGRDFAAKHCDYLFTSFSELESGAQHVADIRARGAAAGRELGAYTVGHVVCRPTEQEARAYYDRYTIEHVDRAALDNHVKKKQGFSNSHDDKAYLLYRQRFAAGTGSYPLVGTPQQIVDELVKIQSLGFSGAALSFVNYADELPYFCSQVLPLMREAGLR
ncbi:MAG TPA: LLM class flavin-dependent oxidoreductase, partial [Bordetella sp.]